MSSAWAGAEIQSRRVWGETMGVSIPHGGCIAEPIHEECCTVGCQSTHDNDQDTEEEMMYASLCSLKRLCVFLLYILI